MADTGLFIDSMVLTFYCLFFVVFWPAALEVGIH